MTSDRPPVEFLADILAYAGHAVSFATGHDRVSLEADTKALYAVEWALIVIGEATKRLPQELRDGHPGIP
jgi:uncharacterized protein with HEPN domain